MNRREAVAALVGLPSMARIAKVADLKPDDVIVCECDGAVSQSAAKSIAETMQAVWPGRKVLVVSEGMRLKVLPDSEVPHVG